LASLFGSVFENDLIKLCIHYFGLLRNRRINEEEIGRNKQAEEENKKEEFVLDMEEIASTDLEESLELVYFKLLKALVNKK
jgi:hypothetical protein